MIKLVKARTPILAFILFVFAVGSAIAQNKIIVIPMAAEDVPKQALPLAYGYVLSDSTPSIDSGYGVTSVTRPSTGKYVVTIDERWAGRPAVIATSFNSSPNTELVTYYVQNNGKEITFNIVNESNNPANSNFSFVVYGSRL